VFPDAVGISNAVLRALLSLLHHVFTRFWPRNTLFMRLWPMPVRCTPDWTFRNHSKAARALKPVWLRHQILNAVDSESLSERTKPVIWCARSCRRLDTTVSARQYAVIWPCPLPCAMAKRCPAKIPAH